MDYKEKYEQGLECLEEILNSGQEKIKMTLLKERLLPFFPELGESEDEQNILFEELKAIHLRMEHQTVCNDAGGNRMWRKVWQHINEAINIIKEDKEAFKW